MNVNLDKALAWLPGVHSLEYFTGARQAKQQRFEGAYRSRWSDQVIVGTGSKLVGFAPQTNSPLKESALLRPDGVNTFVMESPFSLDSPGERARFMFVRDQPKPKRLFWGSQPSERI